MKIWRDKIHWATKPNDKIKRLIWFMFLIRTSQSDEWFTLHDTHTSQILVLHFERVWSLMWIESNWSISWHEKYKVENSEFRWKKTLVNITNVSPLAFFSLCDNESEWLQHLWFSSAFFAHQFSMYPLHIVWQFNVISCSSHY